MGKINNGFHGYSLINYFDVWGNEEDGWEVNNQFVECDDLMISDDAYGDEIVEYMIKANYLTEDARGAVTIDEIGDGMIDIVVLETGEPLYGLRENV